MRQDPKFGRLVLSSPATSAHTQRQPFRLHLIALLLETRIHPHVCFSLLINLAELELHVLSLRPGKPLHELRLDLLRAQQV